MNDSKLKTQPSLLENLIFFVEVRPLCFHTWSHNFTLTVGHTCRDILVLFGADGVHSLVDGKSLCQDPPTTEDQSTEEKEEEEKGWKHSCGTSCHLVERHHCTAHLLSWSALCRRGNAPLYPLSLAASGGVWVPGDDGELAGPDHAGLGAYKGAGNGHDRHETGLFKLGRILTGQCADKWSVCPWFLYEKQYEDKSSLYCKSKFCVQISISLLLFWAWLKLQYHPGMKSFPMLQQSGWQLSLNATNIVRDELRDSEIPPPPLFLKNVFPADFRMKRRLWRLLWIRCRAVTCARYRRWEICSRRERKQ